MAPSFRYLMELMGELVKGDDVEGNLNIFYATTSTDKRTTRCFIRQVSQHQQDDKAVTMNCIHAGSFACDLEQLAQSIVGAATQQPCLGLLFCLTRFT